MNYRCGDVLVTSAAPTENKAESGVRAGDSPEGGTPHFPPKVSPTETNEALDAPNRLGPRRRRTQPGKPRAKLTTSESGITAGTTLRPPAPGSDRASGIQK